MFRYLNGTGLWAYPGNLGGDFGYDEWHHFAFTYHDGHFQLFINGTRVKNMTNSYFLPEVPTNGEYKIGYRTNNNSKCSYEAITIYKGILLTQAEITALADNRVNL